MIVHFVSNNSVLMQLFARKIETSGHLCLVYNSPSYFLKDIRSNPNKPDLVVLDYLSWNHQFFSLRDEMDEYKYYVPYFYFNTPTPLSDSTIHDYNLQMDYMNSYFQLEDKKSKMEQLQPIIKTIAELVDTPVIRQYIPLLQPAKEIPSGFIAEFFSNQKSNENKFLVEFQQAVNLPENLYFLMELFYNNKDSILTFDFIKNHYEKNCKKISEKSLNVLISNLRQYLKKYKEKNCTIKKREGGFIFSIV